MYTQGHAVKGAPKLPLNLLDALRATGRPLILSTGMSTMEECGLPLKSIDTSSSLEQARMPFIGPSALTWRVGVALLVTAATRYVLSVGTAAASRQRP